MKRIRVDCVVGAWLALGVWGCNGESPVVGSSASGAMQTGTGSSSEPKGNVGYFVDLIRFNETEGGPARCLPHVLPTLPDGSASCELVSLSPAGEGCSCDRPGSVQATDATAARLRAESEKLGLCGPGTVDCADLCACEIEQASAQALRECQNAELPSEGAVGWCYIEEGLGNPELVSFCSTEPRARIRALSASLPGPDDVVFLSCLEAPWLRPVAALGEVCVPDRELDPAFSGAASAVATIELGSGACDTGMCLSNHFQGRVSCPYGQTDSDEAASCYVPGSSKPVNVAVQPQLLERPPELASTCSCRCDGPGAGPFCACPESMQCEPLVEAIGLPGEEAYVGSYCIPKGAAYDPVAPAWETCESDECGPARPY